MNEKTTATIPADVETLQVKINNKTSVYIKSTDNGVPLTAPVYAINWFDTKRLWLYNIYNMLAKGSVIKVGGKPFFKGYITDVLLGDESGRRDVLLIVNYQSARHFMRMLESTWFKLISIVRLVSVEKFNFGFTRRTDSGTVSADNDKNKVYAIHHYRAAEDLTARLEALVEAENAEVYYAGRISALLYSGDSLQAKQQVPCLMNGVLILRADKREQIEHLINSDAYQAVVAQTESSFIATLDRTL